MRSRSLVGFACGALLWLIIAFTGREAFALEPRQYAVEVTAQVQLTPPQVRLSWPLDPAGGEYRIFRKTKESSDWGGPITTLPGNSTGFTDHNVQALNAYEYAIEEYKNYDPYPNGSPAEWAVAYGYIYVGVSAPFQQDRGKALLVIDSSVGPNIGPELNQFTKDLTGDGWTVERIEVGRTDSVGSVRAKIADARNRDSKSRSVFLIGHVPVPYSGDIYPDLHRSHRGAWPADAYYGDLDGNWTDSSALRMTSEDPRNYNEPGDGKFDQSELPSDVDLEVGRVDFYDLNIDGKTEIELFKQYFLKNHNYRHKKFSLPMRGLIRDNFGETDGDAPAASAWRTFVPMFGRDNITEVGFGDYFPRLSSEGYLWSFGAGGGSFEHADGVGYTVDFFRRDPKTVFAMLHGSYFGDWDSPNNFLRGALAAPTYTLAAIWAGLPHWYMHHMALGETLGFSTRVTQNNRDTYKSQINYWPRQVHIAVIGDPTLRMQVIAPPSNVRGSVNGAVTLSWDASPEASLGYQVYRGTEFGKPFVKLNRSAVTGTSYTDTLYPGGKQIYMVRAYQLSETFSGSFFNASQGAFWVVGEGPPPQPPTITISAPDATASENGTDPATIIITRSGDSGATLQVNLVLGGSANPAADFESVPALISIPAGQNSAVITLTPRPDFLVEGLESLTISIAAHSSYVVGSPSSVTVELSDQAVPPTVTINAPDATASENGTDAATIVVTRSGELSQALQVNLALSGTADPVADFQNLPTSITIPPGQASGAMTIIPQPDVFAEGTESLIISIAADNSYVVGDPNSVAVHLSDQVIRPTLLGITFTENGSKRLRFTGAAGARSKVEASDDLTEWITLGEVQLDAAGRGEFIDDTTDKLRFYRIEVTP